jgi:hypothetical protein
LVLLLKHAEYIHDEQKIGGDLRSGAARSIMPAEPAPMLHLLIAWTTARADEAIKTGELRESAWSLEQQAVVHLTGPQTAVRVHERVALRTQIWGWAANANLSAKVGIWSNEDFAVAVEPLFWKSWSPGFGAGGWLRASARAEDWVFHLGVGPRYEQAHVRIVEDTSQLSYFSLSRIPTLAGLDADYDEATGEADFAGWRVPLLVGVHKELQTGGLLRLNLYTDPGNLASGAGYPFYGQFNWNLPTSERARLGLGFDLVTPFFPPTFKNPAVDRDFNTMLAEINWPDIPVMALPHLELWWAL